MLQQILKTFGLKPPWAGYRRQEYKSIWNAVSGTENRAKMAVSGCLDAEEHESSAQGTRDWLIEHVGVKRDDVVLEIGAGFGRVGDVLAPLCKTWIGTDVSENMVALIKRRLAHHRNVEAVVTNGFDLSPIPSASVDMAYCTVVFMHLEDWERYGYVKEAFRILKPGGRFIADNISLCTDGGWKLFVEHSAIAPHERPPHISRMSTPQEIETYFSRSGFVNIRQTAIDPMTITYGTKQV